MEFVRKPEEVEIHVKMTRTELGHIVADMRDGATRDDPYEATREFMDYLKGL